MEMSQFLLQSDIKELENGKIKSSILEIKLIERNVPHIESVELDSELSELLSAKASITELENGTKLIKYTRELSTNRGRRYSRKPNKLVERQS